METQEYAAYRGQLEAGRVAYTHYLNTKEVRLETKALLDSLSTVITSTVVGVLMAQEGGLVDDDAPPPTELEQAKLATLAFGEYNQLRAALDVAAGKAYAEIVDIDKGAVDGGIEWWAVAASAGGVLHVIGSLPWAGAPVAKLLAFLLYGCVAYFALTAETEEGKTIVKTIADAAVNAGAGVSDAASSLKSILLWGLGGLAVIGLIGAGIYVIGQAKDTRAARRSQRELSEA